MSRTWESKAKKYYVYINPIVMHENNQASTTINSGRKSTMFYTRETVTQYNNEFPVFIVFTCRGSNYEYYYKEMGVSVTILTSLYITYFK